MIIVTNSGLVRNQGALNLLVDIAFCKSYESTTFGLPHTGCLLPSAQRKLTAGLEAYALPEDNHAVVLPRNQTGVAIGEIQQKLQQCSDVVVIEPRLIC